MGMFFGLECKPGRRTPYVPPPEDHRLHLSQATLGQDPKRDERVVLKLRCAPAPAPAPAAGRLTAGPPSLRAGCRVGSDGSKEVYVCSFRGGQTESCGLDLILDEYAEFSVAGSTSVHLVGYYIPEYEGGAMAEESDDYSSEIDSDEEYEVVADDDSDEAAPWEVALEGATSSDYSDSEEGDLPPQLVPAEDLPTIEEITEEEPAPAPAAGKPDRKGKGKPEKKKDKGKEKPAAAGGSEDVIQVGQKRGAPGGDEKKVKTAKKLEGESISNKAGKAAPKDPPPGRAPEGDAPAKKAPSKKREKAPKGEPAGDSIRRYPNGFEVMTLADGKPSAAIAKPGKRVAMKYVGKLKSNGKVFDKTKGSPFNFRLGVGEVIKGWDLGIRGMRVGEKRRLTIPPALAYGAERTGPIPPNSWLVFDVELVNVK